MSAHEYWEKIERQCFQLQNDIEARRSEWHRHLSLIGSTSFAILVAFPDHTGSSVAVRACFLIALVADILGVLFGVIRLYTSIDIAKRGALSFLESAITARQEGRPVRITEIRHKRLYMLCGRASVACYLIAALFLVVYEIVRLFFS